MTPSKEFYSKKVQRIGKEVLETWNFNPKTYNIIGGNVYPPDPIYGDARSSRFLFKIGRKTIVDPSILHSWFNHPPIVVFYDEESAKKDCIFLPPTKFKAVKIELLKDKF
jgi:hypothetical protein